MVANLTPRWSYVKPGQKLAYFDPFSPDFSQPTPNNEAKEGNNSSSVVKQESPKPAPKQGQKHIPNYITEKKFDNYIEKVRKRLLKQDLIAKFIDDSKLRFKEDEYIGEGDFGSCFMLSSAQNPAAYERLDPPNDITIYSLQKTTDVAVFPLVTSSDVDKAEKPLKPSTDTIDTPDDWLSKLDLTSADLTFDQENRLRQLLSNYPDIFFSKPGRTDVVRHHIDVGDSKPIKQGPYRSGQIRGGTSFSNPARPKDVRAFLGLTGYYRRFIKNYAEVAEPLFDLIREKHNPVFVFTPDRLKAFDLLKERLITAPIVAYPSFGHPFTLQLDACDYGLGAILAQNIDGKEHVIAYASRTLQPCERKYSAAERECLAIVWGTQHFRPYLEGRPFEVWTDHRSLTWLKNIKDPTSRLARWAMKLDAYDMVIKHRPGKANINTDTLSRYPIKTEIVATIQPNSNLIGPIEETQG
ncbi:unnamed protein product, partial [Didymodactylos carnosus]